MGSTAYKRYADIFKRKDNADFGVPVSIVSDLSLIHIWYGDLYVGIGSDTTYLEYKHRKPMFPQEELSLIHI